MAASTTDNIKVAIRVRPLIKREFTDVQQNNINWKVNKNTITQVSNGKLLPSSSYTFDRIFDTCNSTQDVYDEFGKPVVLSAMDGMNGTLFAYGQTSSGKTYTMLGDQNAEGVIPKAIGEIYEYIEQHPSREFLIRVSYMEIYNEDIRDLLNPTKSNLKIHENYQKQVYVGELTEEVVSCREDVGKHMFRGEKNRHFGETNMNERSSRSHTIFRVVIESREMRDEGKDHDSIDGAVRVAHLNLVDLAGSERASQTGAVGQRLREGSHINKSLLALGSVIAKLSEGDSFVPFRDSKLTRILQSSLGGNAKTSMICTVTPAAVEETISTLKFASRAKTIKNCPEVNEVLDDGTLLKRYRKEISELKKQLSAMSHQSTNLHLQELQVEKEKMAELLELQKKQQSEQEEKIKKLRNMICSSGRESNPPPSKVPRLAKRRETWCPGPALSKISLASAVALANHVPNRVGRIPSSSSSEEGDFHEIPKDRFLAILEEEEEERKDSVDEGNKRVRFISPTKRLSTPVVTAEQEEKEIQTEPDEKVLQLQQEVKSLRKDLHEAIGTRDLFNRLLEDSNALIDKMSEDGSSGAKLHEQVSIIQSQCKDLEELKRRNKELEDQNQSFESELTLANEYLTELQAEYEGAQSQNQALSARVEGLENTLACNTSVKTELDSMQLALDENSREREQLHAEVETWKQKHDALELEINRLRSETPGQQRQDTENVQNQLRQAWSDVEDKERKVNEVFEQKRVLEINFELFKAEKENEVLKFKEESERLERKLSEKETTLTELFQQKGEKDEKLDIFKVELEQKANENQELKIVLERVKRERDEIKNDLSETITDTAELQKDMLGMQQKLKDYKEVIHELETERQAMEAALATEKEKVEDLTSQLSLMRQEIEQLPKNDNNGTQKYAATSDESEDKATQIENLISLLEQEKAHVEEVTDERNALKNEVSVQKVEVWELREKLDDLEKQMVELEHACVASDKRFQEEKEKCDAILKELKQRETDSCDTTEVQRELSHELELQKMRKETEELARDLADEKKAHDALRKVHNSLSEEFQQMKHSLVQDKNRDINQQRVIDKMKAERRETICNQAQQRQELEKNLLEAEKRVSELESQCTYLRSEKDLLEHRVEVASKKVEETKQEMRDMENLYSCHDRRAVTQVDDAKAAQKLKQLEFNMDLTKQKFEKAERRLKELEGENRQLRGADIRNVSLKEECDNMRTQLQRAKQVSDEKSRRLNEVSIEVTQLKAHVDKLSEENKKNRSAVEKKDAKIDTLEQKLWETEKELKKERENFMEQQTQSSELEELNSTIQVKHQELEHMTFLVDEREIEIEEVRSRLRESELKQVEMEEKIVQKEQRLGQMETELSRVNENLLEATNKLNEAERKIVELLELAQKHDEEVKVKHDIETEELSCKIDRLERELQERDHKLLEVESELEYTKANCEEAFSIKEDLFALVGVYTKALAEDDVADVIVFDVEHLKRNLELHMRRISCLKETAKSATNLRDQGQASNEEKHLLQVKLGEVKASFEREKASLEEEIENIRNSLLEEKRRVIQLEENVRFTTNEKHALEEELQRVFAENQSSRKSELEKEELNRELEQEKLNQELEKEKLNQELEKEKETNEVKLGELKASFECEKTSLKGEIEELRKCLLDKKRMVIELEENVRFTTSQKDAFEAELRRVFAEKRTAGKSELDNEKLNQELENERLTNEKLKKKIEDLVEELENMRAYDSFKTAKTEKKIKDLQADYQSSLDNWQNNLARTEEELETTRARLIEMEKTSLSLPPTNPELEVLKKNCELAEKTAEETHKMYERETKRLKAIIEEQEGDPEAFTNKIKQLQEMVAAKDLETYWLNSEVSRLRESAMASTTTDMATINQELETLKKKCELAEKKAEETYDMYERETERLKAIIDEQEDDPEGFFRRIEQLQEMVADKDSEIRRLKSEITHAKEVTVAASKQDISVVTKNQEIEALKKKCEQAEKKAEETYEMYEKETERLKAIIDEQEDNPEGFFRQIEQLQEMVADRDSEIRRLKSETSSLKNVAKTALEKGGFPAAINQEINTLKQKCELAERKAEETYEMYERETERLKAIIDKQEDDPEGFFRRIEQLQEMVADKDSEIRRLKSEITHAKEVTVAASKQDISIVITNQEIEALKKKCEQAEKKAEETYDMYEKETERLKAIIDEQEENPDGFFRQIEQLQEMIADRDSEIRRLKSEISRMKNVAKAAPEKDISMVTTNQEIEALKKKCEQAEKKAEEIYDMYEKETERLKAIIDEQEENPDGFFRQIEQLQEMVADRDSEIRRLKSEISRMKNVAKAAPEKNQEGELKTVRGELAQKDLILQHLQYDLYKLQEKHGDEKRKLYNEVKRGEERVASLKLEIRRLRQPDSEDTITMMSSQPCPTKKMRVDSEAGVVSNVAVYSLKAKVGKLESETKKLNKENLQLQKEKSTLSLMNTEVNNKVSQLTCDNQALKAQIKKMAAKMQRLKSPQENAICEGSALALESRNTSILGLSTTDNVKVASADRKEDKPTAPSKPVPKSNWLGVATADVFQDEPNQCSNQ